MIKCKKERNREIIIIVFFKLLADEENINSCNADASGEEFLINGMHKMHKNKQKIILSLHKHLQTSMKSL